ncbi:uroporphyrinogen-III synthase [Paenibacillus ihumii]|uniref:uroporphyrinogen-III synthase n=1 Tax=Paenibacillus ihumii TaxID=687436 RepID=UPI0006D86165|nr:uroporphyrinogen-III synthase [Paenibacillus ihumii]
MARRLEGKRIALTGPRRAEELGKLIENMGGVPLYRPAQGTVFLNDEELRQGIQAWVSRPTEWSIFTTGIGLAALFEMAEELGLLAPLLDNLSKSRIAARGYKTVNVLKKRQLAPHVRDDDGSTDGLIRELGAYDLKDATVLLQLYGDPAPKLVAWLEQQGAICTELMPYRHIAPPEEDLNRLLFDLIEGRVDAVSFTSSPQVRFLFEYAQKQGRYDELIAALKGPVIAVAVGRVTAQGLYEAGIPRVVAPKEERMGSMIVELARFFAGESDPLLTSQ